MYHCRPNHKSGQIPEINNARSYLCDSLRAAHLNISISVRSKLLYLHVDYCICFCIYNVGPRNNLRTPGSKIKESGRVREASFSQTAANN